ncbi:MAG: hypothetical protein AAF581_02360 [Planctomycetota bacterium]
MYFRSLTTLVLALLGSIFVTLWSPQALAQTRLFMAPNGQQATAPTTGNTTITVLPGQRFRVNVWLEDLASGPLLNAYQIMVKANAIPQGTTSGAISYHDNGIGGTGGSVLVDTARTDWVFRNEPVVLPVVYNESLHIGLFGAVYFTIHGTGMDPALLGGIHYLCEFEFDVSADASGTFEIQLNTTAVGTPPLNALFQPDGTEFLTNEVQFLTVQVQSLSQPFVRGDCNADGTFNIADAVYLLSALFPLTAPVPISCSDSCDANDNEGLDIADAVAMLNGLFGPAIPLAAPNVCGADPGGDTLDCDTFPTCVTIGP